MPHLMEEIDYDKGLKNMEFQPEMSLEREEQNEHLVTHRT